MTAHRLAPYSTLSSFALLALLTSGAAASLGAQGLDTVRIRTTDLGGSVYLLHGDGDTVIPTAESALLGEHLRRQGATVHVLLSGLITHAEVDKSAAAAETWKLIRFWTSVLEN